MVLKKQLTVSQLMKRCLHIIVETEIFQNSIQLHYACTSTKVK